MHLKTERFKMDKYQLFILLCYKYNSAEYYTAYHIKNHNNHLLFCNKIIAIILVKYHFFLICMYHIYNFSDSRTNKKLFER